MIMIMIIVYDVDDADEVDDKENERYSSNFDTLVLTMIQDEYYDVDAVVSDDYADTIQEMLRWIKRYVMKKWLCITDI